MMRIIADNENREDIYIQNKHPKSWCIQYVLRKASWIIEILQASGDDVIWMQKKYGADTPKQDK